MIFLVVDSICEKLQQTGGNYGKGISIRNRAQSSIDKWEIECVFGWTSE